MTQTRTVSVARPRVIAHMITSVDGRIVTEGWPLSEEERRQCEQIHATYAANGWLCGRTTMELHFAAGVRSEAELADEHKGGAREDYVAPGTHDSFAFAVDPRGKLLWSSGDIGGDRVVAILSDRVSDEYVASLRESGVSYLFAGQEELDLSMALLKIARLGVHTLMLEGGGAINGSFLRDDLVDEVSLLVAPVVDGRVGTATLFDVSGGSVSKRLVLEGVERRTGGLVHLRYNVLR